MKTIPAKGRPRSENIDHQILKATKAILEDRGYTRLSVEAVAKRARVSKATIYLRYKNKAALVAAAATAEWEVSNVPDCGNARDDLIALLESSVTNMTTPLGAPLIGALLAEEPHNPASMQAYRDTIIAARYKMYRTVLLRGVQRGELGTAANLDMAYEMLTGWWYAHHLLGKQSATVSIPEYVDTLLRGIGTGSS